MLILLTLILSIIVMAFMMIGLGIKRLFTKKGEFKRPCSNVDPYTGQGGGCLCRQQKTGEKATKGTPRCPASTKGHTPLEINQEFLEEIE